MRERSFNSMKVSVMGRRYGAVYLYFIPLPPSAMFVKPMVPVNCWRFPYVVSVGATYRLRFSFSGASGTGSVDPRWSLGSSILWPPVNKLIELEYTERSCDFGHQ